MPWLDVIGAVNSSPCKGYQFFIFILRYPTFPSSTVLESCSNSHCNPIHIVSWQLLVSQTCCKAHCTYLGAKWTSAKPMLICWCWGMGRLARGHSGDREDKFWAKGWQNGEGLGLGRVKVSVFPLLYPNLATGPSSPTWASWICTVDLRSPIGV